MGGATNPLTLLLTALDADSFSLRAVTPWGGVLASASQLAVNAAAPGTILRWQSHNRHPATIFFSPRSRNHLLLLASALSLATVRRLLASDLPVRACIGFRQPLDDLCHCWECWLQFPRDPTHAQNRTWDRRLAPFGVSLERKAQSWGHAPGFFNAERSAITVYGLPAPVSVRTFDPAR